MTSILGSDWLDELRAELGAQAILVERSDLAALEQGWRYGQGRALAAVRPSTNLEVQKVVQIAQRHGLRIQPMGANTGLVGASNPDASGEQLVLSMERLNRHIEVDPVDRVVVADAGVTLSQLNSELAQHGLMFPVDLGADPQLGGMLVTNTGGTRLVRYGDVRQNLLGVEVVLADGTRIDGIGALRKNNTGLDWKQIYCGTSGTFGIVTRVALQVVPIPVQRTAMLAAANSGDAVLALLAHLERKVGETLSAFEVLSADALEVTLQHGANLRNPFGTRPPAYAVLVELSTALDKDLLDLEAALAQTLEDFVESEAAQGLEDALVGQAEDFWAIRHQVSESLRAWGRVLALDLSVPRSRLAEFSAAVRAEMEAQYPFVRVCDFGHWGDGGTHLNLVWRDADAGAQDAEELRDAIQDRIYRLCVEEFQGSYSAEHGVGPHNQSHYQRFTHPRVRGMVAALKMALDPETRVGSIDLT